MGKGRMIGLLLAASLAAGNALAEGDGTPGWAEISAIFTERCVMCHSQVAGASKKLLLDTYAGALAGSERGTVLIAGDPAGSELMRRLRGESTPRMPFLSRPLPDNQIVLIEHWIAAGLPEIGEAK